MVRKALILVILVLAAPATPPFAASHVRPPGMALGKPSVIAPAAAELNPSVIPAWVQALGSIGAILVAIWIGDRAHRRSVRVFEETRRREEDDRRRKARSLAIALYPELLEMKPVLERVIIANAPMREPPLGIPPVLTESVDRLYLLGDAGDAIQQCLATARQLERMLQEVHGRPRSNDTNQAIRRQIEVSAGALDEALKLVEPIHDNPIDPET